MSSARPSAGASRSRASASTAPRDRRPLVVFENEEKPKLRPLVAARRFDPPVWAEAKVHPDHHIQFEKGLYSVPTRHVGKTGVGARRLEAGAHLRRTASASRPTSPWARATVPQTMDDYPRRARPLRDAATPIAMIT